MSIFAGKDPIWTARRGAVSAGLVGHWDSMALSAADRMGNIWYDISGNNNHGTLTNGASFENRGVRLDGVDDYIPIVNKAILYGNNTFTISSFTTWNGPSGGVIYSEDIGGGTVFIFRVFSNGTVDGGINSAGNWTFVTTTESIISGTPYYLTLVGNISTLKIFINSVEKATAAWNGQFSATIIASAIGRTSNAGANGYFNGRLDDIRLYNRALSQSEILRNFNATRARFGV